MPEYRRENPDRPEIVDGRYYLARKFTRLVIAEQPRCGFRTVMEAEAFLVGRYWEDDMTSIDRYVTVEGAQIA